MLVFLYRRTFLYLVHMVLLLQQSTSCHLFHNNKYDHLIFLLFSNILLQLCLLDNLRLLQKLLQIIFLLEFVILLLGNQNSFELILLWSNLLMTSFLTFQNMLNVYCLQLLLCHLFLHIFDSLLVLFLMGVFLLIDMVLMVAFLLLWIILMGRFLVLMVLMVLLYDHVL